MRPILNITPSSYQPHALHGCDRMWPQTNCYTDLWIELLATKGLPPQAMLGFTLTQDFEGDQMGFFKVPLEDLESLFGIKVSELAIYDRVETHIALQGERGRICLVEMDSYYMPDTQGVAYKIEHGKTTVAINRLDVEKRELDYFHNDGFFHLCGEDFEGLFEMNAAQGARPFLPYTEFVKFPASSPDMHHIRQEAFRLGRAHFMRRPEQNPLASFATVFADDAARIADKPSDFFHKYAFNTLRQAGANFELCGSYFDWLGEEFREPAEHARKISQVMKSTQFQFARALNHKKFDTLKNTINPAAKAWQNLIKSTQNIWG